MLHLQVSLDNEQLQGINKLINKFSLNRRGYVPDVILATVELPDDLPVVGIGCLIQASVCRPKRDLRSESNAKEISDGLPFLGESTCYYLLIKYFN